MDNNELKGLQVAGCGGQACRLQYLMQFFIFHWSRLVCPDAVSVFNNFPKFHIHLPHKIDGIINIITNRVIKGDDEG
jgi:hypothetical protein